MDEFVGLGHVAQSISSTRALLGRYVAMPVRKNNVRAAISPARISAATMYSRPVAESSERMRAVRQVITVAASGTSRPNTTRTPRKTRYSENNAWTRSGGAPGKNSSSGSNTIWAISAPRHRNVSWMSGLTDSVGDTRYQWPSDSPAIAEPSAIAPASTASGTPSPSSCALEVTSAADHSAAVGSISAETSGGNTLRSQMARAPQTRKQMPVNSVKPRLTSPRALTQNSAIVPPTAASNRRRNAACGSACTSPVQLQRGALGLTNLFGLIRPGVVVLEAQSDAGLGR